jgi:hypothetical protein
MFKVTSEEQTHRGATETMILLKESEAASW